MGPLQNILYGDDGITVRNLTLYGDGSLRLEFVGMHKNVWNQGRSEAKLCVILPKTMLLIVKLPRFV